jgi:hypothetical protein
MSSLLALDLSKTSTGYAIWTPGSDRPVSGTWKLGSDMTTAGMVFINLHRQMSELYSVSPFDNVLYEEPLNLGPHSGFTNKDTIFLLVGLAAHVDSFCEAKRLRKYRCINNSSWRRTFLGKMKRGTKTKQLKDYAFERCHQLGFRPANADEADALGILDHMCELERIIPPWRANEVLRQPLGALG